MAAPSSRREDNPSWSRVLRALREARGLTQEVWADLLGYSVPTIQRWERGTAVPNAAAEAAIVAACQEHGLFRAHVRRPWQGITLTPESLRDLLAAARIHEGRPQSSAGTATRPAARERSGETRPGNLPAPLTSFIGRDAEVEELAQQLKGARLLTLTGPGGCGKTRLAIEAALVAAESFAHGAWFVDLAPISDPELVMTATAGALEVREASDQPPGEVLKRALRDRNLLLVLDNFEHVLGAGPRVTDLLRACPGVTALVTSRTPMRVSGEHQVRVEPLPTADPLRLPPVDVLGHYPAVALFVARAAAISPGFALTRKNAAAVAKICAHLDGLPLALELAAARSDVLPPEILLSRLEEALPGGTARLWIEGLRDLPARQHTLHATLEWSYGLLDEPHQRLFRRLGAFGGSWTLDAAEQIVVDSPSDTAEPSVRERLDRLADHSLLLAPARDGWNGSSMVGDGNRPPAGQPLRYRMLETVREYAVGQLTAAGERPTVETRHASHFLTMAEAAMTQERGPEQRQWLALLDADHDNLRAVLARGGATGARLAVALTPFWETRGHLDEGRHWLERAAVTAAEFGPALHARVLTGLGRLAARRGDFTEMHARMDEALPVYREAGEPRGIANALNNVGLAAYRQRDFARARSHLEEALALYREIGDEQGAGHALSNLGVAAALAGDYGAAQARFEQVLALRHALGDEAGIARALLNLGSVALDRGDFAGARTQTNAALALLRKLGNRTVLTETLANLTTVLYLEGDRPGALAHAWETLRLAREIGMVWMEWSMLGMLGALAEAAGRHARAVRLLAGARTQLEAMGANIEPRVATLLTEAEEAARAALGDVAFDAASAAGRDMTLEQALAVALEDEG